MCEQMEEDCVLKALKEIGLVPVLRARVGGEGAGAG